MQKFTGLKRHFTEHPASVDETYGEHFRVAMYFSGQLAKASLACAMHALVPSRCCTTGSDSIKRLYGEVTHRGPEGDCVDETRVDETRADSDTTDETLAAAV